MITIDFGHKGAQKDILIQQESRRMHFLSFREVNEFEDLSKICKKIAKSSTHSYGSQFASLLSAMFPPERSSHATTLFQSAVNSVSTQWTKKMKSFVSIFQPNSEFGEALIINRDLRVDLKGITLGSEYEVFFNTKDVVQDLSIRKEMSMLTLPAFECFFIRLVSQHLKFKQYQKRGSWKQSFQNDEFYYYIIRNPILHIIRQWLIHTRTRPFIFNRILTVMEILLIREPMFRFRKGESSLSIKTYHFHGIYLLIEWKTSSLVWSFLSFIVDYLETKQKNFNVLFCCWVRLHFILLKRGSPYELSLRREMEEGLNNLQMTKVRINSIDDFQEEFRKIQDRQYLENLFIQVDSLLSKELWTATPQFLVAILTILFMADNERIDQKKIQSSLVTEIGKTIQKMDNTLRKKEDKFIHDLMKEIKEKYITIGGNLTIEEENEEELDFGNKGFSTTSIANRGSIRTSAVRKSFVSYQRPLDPWESPIKASESHLFYGLGYTIAERIDKLRGKKGKNPSTNLRFLASYTTIAFFLVLLFFIVILFY